jgi:hypothetical protein
VLPIKKQGHSKERCHYNFKNPNNQFNEKKEVSMNEMGAQTSKGIRT